MDRDTLFLSAIIVVGVLAILNAWRGGVLMRSGDAAGGRKHLVLGLAMIMLMVVAALIWEG